MASETRGQPSAVKHWAFNISILTFHDVENIGKNIIKIMEIHDVIMIYFK